MLAGLNRTTAGSTLPQTDPSIARTCAWAGFELKWESTPERCSASHDSIFMKFASLVLLAAGPASFLFGQSAAAANDPSLGAEVAALEKKLAAVRDELAEAKTALAISKAETEAAETRARARSGPDSQLDALRAQVRVLERDLQSATNALKRIASDKAAIEAALFAANEQLVAAGKTAVPPRGQIPAAPPGAIRPDPKVAELRAELSDVRTRLALAEKASESREADLTKLRAALTTAESRPAIPAQVTQELTDLRAQLAAAREFGARLHVLEAEKTATASRIADLERKLTSASEALAIRSNELESLRPQAARVADLESRLRHAEAEKTSGPAGATPPAANPDEVARLTAARAEAESKLSTVLRSFTLLTKERDELRARLAELTKASGDQEKR
jgi:chromosome segregation ATPase